jgi:photosynthetic reaction center H subunit
MAPWPGAPLIPTGNPMVDGIGPGAWANRPDEPERAFDDEKPRIMPLRILPDFFVPAEDHDPRGMPVIGLDNAVAGHVRDIWVDRSEVIIRYLEVDVGTGAELRRVLVPMPLCALERKLQRIKVKSVLASQFALAPLTKSLEQVTLLEEDKICAYFASGNLYATPERQEPLI